MRADTAAPFAAPLLSGIGDEAGASLDEQLSALTTLGWSGIELRSVDGTALADLDDAAFGRLTERLAAAGLGVTCVDSRIANWARPISGDFEEDLRELRILADRCERLGTRNVRVMSYPNDGWSEERWRDAVLDRMGKLTAHAEDAGLVLLHENCAGWAGSSAERMLGLLEAVDSPALKLLFDTGNGVAYDYEAYDLLPSIAPHVAHVHIKDAVGTRDDVRYTLPGDGRCRVADAVRYLTESGYRGVWSIEPHINVRPHESLATSGEDGVAAFVGYGRALEALFAGLAGEAT
ncbi:MULTISPECIES: sugar phosphate isomerase/epimerase family protein [unclassified Streptomyces]|uniref:sugar phosphate isomerase/epimerase family protein n=1 Tax=unclassified Streptomyces TaxID=2593676 RepID=UPI0022B6C90B|nr:MULTISPECIES: sugar phosphate isomerase/epimerase family protein [unclassified Streptomyces]MCZ7414542.1 sugar phosphate isomerase/epimerase [Streptomyces sp. WMMC897]MCZ7431469.1 sugar phosphate isomerase/epimerase [Streptomyces sp. WMMC1477]